MKRGRPKSAPGEQPRRARGRSQAPDAAATMNEADPDAAAVKLNAKGRPAKSKSNKQPRATTKRSLMSALLGELLRPPKEEGGKPRDLLTRADRDAVRQAHADGLTVEDLSALVVYEIRVAQRLFAAGELAGKDLVVALNKAASQVAAAAQLAAGAANKALPDELRVVFTQEGLPTAQGMPGRDEVVRAPPGPTGDRLDVEG